MIHFSLVQEDGGEGVPSTSFTVTMDMQTLYYSVFLSWLDPIISKCFSGHFNVSFSLVQLVCSPRRGDSFHPGTRTRRRGVSLTSCTATMDMEMLYRSLKCMPHLLNLKWVCHLYNTLQLASSSLNTLNNIP